LAFLAKIQICSRRQETECYIVTTLKTLLRRENFHATTPHRSPPPLRYIHQVNFCHSPSRDHPLAKERLPAGLQQLMLEIAKREKISTTAEIPDSCSEGGALSGSDSEDIAIDSEPEDDVFVFHQPDNSGWAKAERQLKGYSKTNAGKTTHSRWYYSQKKKKPREGNCQIAKNLWAGSLVRKKRKMNLRCWL